MAKKVLITGATGFVGKALGAQLVEQGYEVLALVRKKGQAVPFRGKAITMDQVAEVQGLHAVVHLAGESIAQRWSEAAKKRIIESRVETARKLRRALGSQKISLFISASGVGYYGDRGDEKLVENSATGDDFLAQVCQEWEKAAHEFEAVAERVVVYRFGLVIGKGGVVEKMAPPFKLGLGGNLGSGQQWMSWIHLADLVNLIAHAIESKSIKGIYNAVSPEPVRNEEFTKMLAARFGKKPFFAAPTFALKLALGEMAEMLLGSQRVSARKVLDSDFTFRFPALAAALADAIRS